MSERESETDGAAGSRIVTASWLGTGVLLAALVPTVIAPDPLGTPFAILSVVLFAMGCGAFFWGYARAVSRSRFEVVSLSGLYFLSGTAPKTVRRSLMLPLVVQIVGAIVAASIRPYTPVAFAILAPVFGLGLVGLWGARHGRFPARELASGKAPRR